MIVRILKNSLVTLYLSAFSRIYTYMYGTESINRNSETHWSSFSLYILVLTQCTIITNYSVQ
jgi:hypothetical protein